MKRFVALVTGVEMLLLGAVAVTGPVQAQVPGPNGRIAFARYAASLDETVTYTANPDGSQVQRLLPGASGFPRWSPDGREIAVLCCDNAAVIVNPDTGSFRELEMPDPTLFTACPVWSPDGTRLACGGFGETDPSRNGIYTIRASDGGGLTRITSNPGGDDEVGDYSPDGKRLVFTRVDKHGEMGLFVVKLSGAGLRQISPPDMVVTGGSWSPRGDEIVFSMRTTPDHRFAIWVVNSDGSGLHPIPITPSCGGSFSDPKSIGCTDPHWSPDGTKIAFVRVSARSTQSDIYTVNADGTSLTQITHDGFNEVPDWGTHPLVTS